MPTNFSTLESRVARRGAFYKAAKTELLATPSDESDRIRFYQLENSQCTASDDARLKEK